MPSNNHAARHGLGLATMSAVLLGGCATLPSSGPTARQIVRAQRASDNILGYDIVDIGPRTVAAAEAGTGEPSALAALAAEGRVDTIGPGDVLSIQIFEVGYGLFSERSQIGTAITSDEAAAPTAEGTTLGTGVAVDRDGAIALPYVGRLRVAGLTPTDVQHEIEARLVGRSQQPQVLVSIRQNVSNTVVVMGSVARPGRQSLTLARARLLDAIAAAGGASSPTLSTLTTNTTGAPEIVVRLTRGGRSAEQPLESIVSGSPDDLVLLPGDRIQLVNQRRSVGVFGATDRISEVPFEGSRVSLAQALARVGGPSDARADPTAVFVFRYAPADSGAPLAPTPAMATAGTAAAAPPGMTPHIYRLNMMKAESYFVAQRFEMRDKDVIYIANARANQPAKLAQIVGLLFSPFLAARAATQ